MADQIQEQLKELKKRFRALTPKSREDLSVCLLKINLGVNHDKELQKVKDFIGDAPVHLAAGELDAFIEFMHSDSVRPPRLTQKAADLQPYREDEVETLRDEIRPPSLRSKTSTKIKK